SVQRERDERPRRFSSTPALSPRARGEGDWVIPGQFRPCGRALYTGCSGRACSCGSSVLLANRRPCADRGLARSARRSFSPIDTVSGVQYPLPRAPYRGTQYRVRSTRYRVHRALCAARELVVFGDSYPCLLHATSCPLRPASCVLPPASCLLPPPLPR